MKKILFITASLLSWICLLSCGSKKEAENEEMTEPEYETSSVTAAVLETEDKVVDGWLIMPREFDGKTEYIYAPYIENKIKGVSYWDDIYDNSFDIYAFMRINTPDGCEFIKPKAMRGEVECSYQPNLGYNDYDAEREERKNELQYVIEGNTIYGDTSEIVASNEQEKNVLIEHDVWVMSCALYEDFFEKIPGLTVKVYGIERDYWESRLGSDVTYSRNAYDEMLETAQENNFADFKLLASKQVSETGVYYIDYRDFEAEGDFVEHIIVLEFDKAQEYTFYVLSPSGYNISDEQKYNEWKQNNRESFIN